MDKFTIAEINDIINIIKSSCYQNFLTYHNKVINYLVYEFASDYSVKVITDIALQFYNTSDENILKIQTCLNNDSKKMSLMILYLINIVKYKLDEKYKK